MCNDLKCKFCGSNRINKRGKQKYNGKQRYLCREARSGSKSSLLEFASLSSHEVPTEQSEGETRSPTDASLLDFGSLSVGKVRCERSECSLW